MASTTSLNIALKNRHISRNSSRQSPVIFIDVGLELYLMEIEKFEEIKFLINNEYLLLFSTSNKGIIDDEFFILFEKFIDIRKELNKPKKKVTKFDYKRIQKIRIDILEDVTFRRIINDIVNSYSSIDSVEECIICMDKIKLEDSIQLECSKKHIFHKSCITKALLYSNNTCPLCRKKIFF